ncbi:MAG: glucose 1-dehydrogenase [Chloroflexi bacterium]|nr:glucose 1-dehydrogenase [Chloroflexota bacterium]
MGRFDGQVAIVTGGAQGIGGGTARRLASEGARVLIADIDGAAAQANVDRIRKAGGTAEALHADMARSSDIKTTASEAVARWGRLDILVQNAWGGAYSGKVRGSAVEVSEEAWDYGMAVMTKALYLGAKYAVPEMARNRRGSIVNIASVHGLLMARGKLVYEAAKTCVIGMTRQMAVDFGPLGIRVNCICPGHIVTERIQETTWKNNPAGRRFFEQQYPVGRTGTPDDIAGGIAYLCSQDAGFVTGHALVIDGGLSIQLQEDLGVQLAHWALENRDVKLPY